MRLVARLLRAAQLAAALLALPAAPAFAQIFTLLQPPDLTVGFSASPSSADAATIVTYSLVVNNVPTTRNLCRRDPLTWRYVCGPEVTSAGAVGVVLQVGWSGGAQFFGASGDSGFNCSGSGTQATCANASIAAGGTGHITLQLRMPNAAAGVALTATVDPLDAVYERSNANNVATAATTVLAPTGNRPDLECSIASVDQFNGRAAVDYTVYLRNSGPLDAGNVTLQFYAPLTTGLLWLTPSNGFSCYFLSGANQPLSLQCVGGSIRAFDSAVMTLRLSPDGQLPSGTPFALTTRLDPQDVIPELLENNNVCTKAVVTVP